MSQNSMPPSFAVPPPSLDWVGADLDRFDLPEAYALIVPGGAPHRPEKRWPLANFAELATKLAGDGVTPVVAGGASEREAGVAIAAAEASARDLTGRTDLQELVVLARGARLAVGNDTGPMHIAAVSGIASVVLFGAGSEPSRAAPRGLRVTVLQRSPLATLSVPEVLEAVRAAIS